MIELLALVVALPLVVATSVLFAEIALGARRPQQRMKPLSQRQWTSVVVIPAHDEALVIGATLGNILRKGGESCRVLVVADNCSDATAAIARAAGAEVIERIDADLRGKGYALAFARAHLATNAPDCVVVIDADTVPAPGALDLLATEAIHNDRPVQAAYFFEPAATATPLARFSAIAFYIKNVVRQLGLARLRAPAILTGSGMAFPWRIFDAMPLDTGHVTEDLMLGIWCAITDAPPVFLAEAIVRGEASSDAGTSVQRRRWESGFFDTAREYVPQLLATGFRTRSPRLIWLALHLMTPPLLLLLALDMLALIALALLALLSGAIGALVLLACVTAGAVVALAVATMSHGRRIALSDLARIPGYIVWKLALSVRTLVRRETRWIRTNRE